MDPEENLADAAGGTPQSDVLDMPLDMPVDPNEPTYCLCHQVSYGEMIGCDNLDVSSHFQEKTQTKKSNNFCSIILHTVSHRMVSFCLRGFDD